MALSKIALATWTAAIKEPKSAAFSPLTLNNVIAILYYVADENIPELEGFIRGPAFAIRERPSLNKYIETHCHWSRAPTAVFMNPLPGDRRTMLEEHDIAILSTEKLSEWFRTQSQGHLEWKLDTSLIRIAIISVFAFDFPWLSAFDPELSNPGYFGTNARECIYMHKEIRDLEIIDTERYEGVVLPYANGAEAIFVMPKPGFTLDDTVHAYASGVKTIERGFIHLPRFSLSFEQDLMPTLSSFMAITPNVFDGTSIDMPGLDAKDVALSSFNIGCRLIVDERGSRGAAFAAAVAMRGASRPTRVFRFNQPFTMFIKHGHAILCVAKVCDDAHFLF